MICESRTLIRVTQWENVFTCWVAVKIARAFRRNTHDTGAFSKFTPYVKVNTGGRVVSSCIQLLKLTYRCDNILYKSVKGTIFFLHNIRAGVGPFLMHIFNCLMPQEQDGRMASKIKFKKKKPTSLYYKYNQVYELPADYFSQLNILSFIWPIKEAL